MAQVFWAQVLWAGLSWIRLCVARLSLRHAAAGLGLIFASGCSFGQSAPEPPAPAPLPWDVRPEAQVWRQAATDMLNGPAIALLQSEPADIDAWCPAYRDAPATQRSRFWTGLLAALARYESTWNPDVVAGGGRYFGLMQISPATARFYGCQAGSGEALLDGPANIRCALRIWAVTVPRDNAVSAGGGIAADWGPMSRPGPREEMRAFSLAQPYCQ